VHCSHITLMAVATSLPQKQAHGRPCLVLASVFLGVFKCSPRYGSSLGRFSQIWLKTRFEVKFSKINLLYSWLDTETQL
jgi:hypothetical protein